MMTYQAWVRRIWKQLEHLTGATVFYVDARHIAARCPACLDGCVRVAFVEHPEPGFTVDSIAGVGVCSRGCGEDQIARVVFS